MSTKGSFVPTFSPSGETVTESYMNKNNQLGTATDYTIGSTVEAHFAVNDDTDIYKMNVSKAGYLNLRFSNDISSMNMTIMCPDEEIKYEEKGIPLGSSSYKYFVPAGSYYISFNKDNYDGTYTFSSSLSDMAVTKVKTARNLKGKKAKITWSKVSDIDGYQVQVGLNKKFSKGKKTKNITVNANSNPKTCTFSKLKKKKTYYSRIRTYKVVNGEQYYSAWSTPKKFKITK